MYTNPKLCKKSTSLPLLVAMAAFVILPVQAAAQTFITIDPPGAGTTAGLGTQSTGINQSGVSTGFFWDSKFVAHSFRRAADGTITTFDAPGSGGETIAGFLPSPAGILGGQGTYATSINQEGTIAGLYIDSSAVGHGFVRSKDGDFTTFDAPNAASAPGAGTYAFDINAVGTTAGWYYDASGVVHSYIRTRDGSFVQFDPPGTAFGAGQGSLTGAISSINPSGAIAGWYFDTNSVSHGYVRTKDGEFATFEVPGAGTKAFQGTYAWTINPSETAAGQWVDDNWELHGFVRHSNGRITTFDYPGAGTDPGQGTAGGSINPTGDVVGNYIDDNFVNHGFMRSSNGPFTTFDVPGAGTGPGQGTIPTCNNSAGTTTGIYVDGNGVLHGFLWMPKR